MSAAKDPVLACRLLPAPAEVERTLQFAPEASLRAYRYAATAVERAAASVLESRLRNDHVRRLRASVALAELEVLAADILDELRAEARRGRLAPSWWN
jgi:hypothetical protein